MDQKKLLPGQTEGQFKNTFKCFLCETEYDIIFKVGFFYPEKTDGFCVCHGCQIKLIHNACVAKQLKIYPHELDE